MLWRLRSRTLELGQRTLVMGVVNITPDSFSDGGAYFQTEDAIAQGLQLLDEGADLLDLGAESTRPGSHAGENAAVGAAQEQERLLPVLGGILRERPQTIVSVDTYKAATATAAIAAGAEIVNDVSGFHWDPFPPRLPLRRWAEALRDPSSEPRTPSRMATACARLGCGVILMHTRGMPDAWSTQPPLEHGKALSTVRDGLAASLQIAAEAGIAKEAIVLDPGYGFGKRFEENYILLAQQAELLALGRPLLAGVSRKSFLGKTLAPLFGGKLAPPECRQTATIAAITAAILSGASVVRVHAARPAVEAARIADAVLAGAD